SDGLAKVFGLVRLHEFDVDANTAEADIELRVSAAVKSAGRNDFVAGTGETAERKELRGLSARRRERRHAAFESRHALLENVRGGIHNPRINVPELLQSEQRCRMFRVIKRERCALINGHRARMAGGVGRVSGVQTSSGEAHLALGRVVFGHKLED